MIRSSVVAVLSAVSFSLAGVAFAQTTGTQTTGTDTTGSQAVGSQASSGNLKPLELKLPKPVFVGTPKNFKSTNLEKPTGKPREPLMVPEGTELLSKDKPVTASDEEPTIGEIEQVTDGDREAAEGSFVEFGPGVQWVQIDLGQKSEIAAVLIWHFHQQARVYRDVIVKVADDPDMITNVTTIFNNDHDNSAKLGVGTDKEYVETNEGKLIDAKGAKGRYVRLYSAGNTSNDMNHYTEVEVYGKPLE